MKEYIGEIGPKETLMYAAPYIGIRTSSAAKKDTKSWIVEVGNAARALSVGSVSRKETLIESV